MRYAHILFRIVDVLFHLVRLFRGNLTELISLSLSVLELYETVRRWLEEAGTRQAKEQPLEIVAYEAA